MNYLGIDFGSKLAGTTAIVYLENGTITVRQSVKNKDADAFILETVQELKPDGIFLDAPLSLPLAFYNKGNNYFYRECDQQLKAMSPMFLGGLTARAMRLKSILTKQSITVHETYPKALADGHNALKEVYNKKNKDRLSEFCERLKTQLDIPFKPLTNWHQVDAVLAWWSGQRYHSKNAIIIGQKDESQIVY